MKLFTLGTSHGDPTMTRFNSALVLQVGNANYLFEAGAPVNALMIRKNLAFADLKAVFVSHAHEDHIGGLPGLIKSLVKRPVDGQHTDIFLPEQLTIDGVMAFMRATHRMWPDELLDFSVIKAGKIFEDSNITVEAVPTLHMSNEKMSFPSFAFVVTAENKRIVFTGDISRSLKDIPIEALSTPAICVMECQHYDPVAAGEILRKLPIERYIGVHVSNKWDALGEAAFIEALGNPAFPVVMCEDGMEFEL